MESNEREPIIPAQGNGAVGGPTVEQVVVQNADGLVEGSRVQDVHGAEEVLAAPRASHAQQTVGNDGTRQNEPLFERVRGVMPPDGEHCTEDHLNALFALGDGSRVLKPFEGLPPWAIPLPKSARERKEIEQMIFRDETKIGMGLSVHIDFGKSGDPATGERHWMKLRPINMITDQHRRVYFVLWNAFDLLIAWVSHRTPNGKMIPIVLVISEYKEQVFAEAPVRALRSMKKIEPNHGRAAADTKDDNEENKTDEDSTDDNPGDNYEDDVTQAEDEASEEDAYNDDTDVDEEVSNYAPTPKAEKFRDATESKSESSSDSSSVSGSLSPEAPPTRRSTRRTITSTITTPLVVMGPSTRTRAQLKAEKLFLEKANRSTAPSPESSDEIRAPPSSSTQRKRGRASPSPFDSSSDEPLAKKLRHSGRRLRSHDGKVNTGTTASSLQLDSQDIRPRPATGPATVQDNTVTTAAQEEEY